MNANINSPGEFRIQNAGSTVNLNSGTFTAGTINVQGGGAINRTGGNYAATALSLSNGASLSYQGSDNLVANVALASGATFALEKNLGLTTTLSVADSTLNLNGHQAAVGTFSLSGTAPVNRGIGGGVQGQNFSVTAGASYVIDGSDNFTTTVSVSNGATAANNVPLTLSTNLAVSGAGASYTVNAPLGLSTFLSLISNGGMLSVNANINSPGELRISNAGSTLNLNSGTLTAGTLTVQSGAVVNRTGGTYALAVLASPMAPACHIRERTVFPQVWLWPRAPRSRYRKTSPWPAAFRSTPPRSILMAVRPRPEHSISPALPSSTAGLAVASRRRALVSPAGGRTSSRGATTSPQP